AWWSSRVMGPSGRRRVCRGNAGLADDEAALPQGPGGHEADARVALGVLDRWGCWGGHGAPPAGGDEAELTRATKGGGARRRCRRNARDVDAFWSARSLGPKRGRCKRPGPGRGPPLLHGPVDSVRWDRRLAGPGSDRRDAGPTGKQTPSTRPGIRPIPGFSKSGLFLPPLHFVRKGLVRLSDLERGHEMRQPEPRPGVLLHGLDPSPFDPAFFKRNEQDLPASPVRFLADLERLQPLLQIGTLTDLLQLHHGTVVVVDPHPDHGLQSGFRGVKVVLAKSGAQ